jgi:hypothetical protein
MRGEVRQQPAPPQKAEIPPTGVVAGSDPTYSEGLSNSFWGIPTAVGGFSEEASGGKAVSLSLATISANEPPVTISFEQPKGPH